MSSKAILSMVSPPLPYYLECGKVDYIPGEQHPNRRRLGVFDLLLVISGRLFIGEEGRQWEVSSGQTLILRPDGHHYAVKPCEEETGFYWIHFQAAGEWGEFEDELSSVPAQGKPVNRKSWSEPYSILLPKYADLPSPEQAYALLRRLRELATVRRSRSFWQEQQLFLDLLNLMEEAQKAGESSPSLLLAEKTETYIKRHYRDDLSNTVMAEALHFHPNYITRCMKEVFHCTPMEYLHRYRVDQAKLLLIKTEWPVAQIAEEVGFHSTPYFSLCFKKKERLSPLQFRKQYAK